MKQQLPFTEASLIKSNHTKHALYNKYGAMLLGYILEVVKSRQIAEQYLIDIFTELQTTDLEVVTQTEINTFCCLQRLVRNKIATFTQSTANITETDQIPKGTLITSNKFISLMTTDEQHVFCGIHYHGKSTASLAMELNKPETTIRQILRDSFTKIRNNRDTAAVH